MFAEPFQVGRADRLRLQLQPLAVQDGFIAAIDFRIGLGQDQSAHAFALVVVQGQFRLAATLLHFRIGVFQKLVVQPCAVVRTGDQPLIARSQLRHHSKQKCARLVPGHGLHPFQRLVKGTINQLPLGCQHALSLVQFRHADQPLFFYLAICLGLVFRLCLGIGNALIGFAAQLVGAIVGLVEDRHGVLPGILLDLLQDRCCIHERSPLTV